MSVIKTSKIMHPDAVAGGVELHPDGSMSFDGEDAIATEDYVASQISTATTGLATESYVDQEVAGAVNQIPTSTDDVAEGINNLYFTDERADARAIVFAIALGG